MGPWKYIFISGYFITLSVSRRDFFNHFKSWHTEKGAKIVKAHHQFLRKDFIIKKKTSNKIVFKSSVAKFLITVLFFKIMLIIDFDYFLFNFFLTSFWPYPKFPRHTCGPFRSHQCAITHRLQIADLDYTVLNGRMTNKWCIGKDLQGSGHGLTQVLSQHLPGAILENHKSLSQNSWCRRPRFKPRTSKIWVYGTTTMLTCSVRSVKSRFHCTVQSLNKRNTLTYMETKHKVS
jgi:hypothetical protein